MLHGPPTGQCHCPGQLLTQLRLTISLADFAKQPFLGRSLLLRWESVPSLHTAVADSVRSAEAPQPNLRGADRALAAPQAILFVDDKTVSKGMVKYATNLPRESIVDVSGEVHVPDAPVAGCTCSTVRLLSLTALPSSPCRPPHEFLCLPYAAGKRVASIQWHPGTSLCCAL